MNPKLEARAFLIWRYCRTHGQENVTQEEVGEALGISQQLVAQAVRYKGWQGMFHGADRSKQGRRMAAFSGRALGRRFDENVLDLVELMGA